MPTVVITGQPTSTLYAGTALSLFCAANINPAVDVDVTVNGYWESDERSTSNDRITVVPSTSTTLQANISFHPLDVSDSALYSCVFSVAPTVASPFIISNSDIDVVELSVEGGHARS